MQTENPSKRNENKSVVQKIINYLTEAVLSRQIKPGERIPTETELEETLGVGRNSVREAIKILVHLGVLEIRRGEGTFVLDGFSENMIDPMIYGIILQGKDSGKDLMELREMMEVGVMQLAMKKIDPDGMQDLEARLHQLKKEIEKGPGNIEKVFHADNEFHSAISDMGQNPLIGKINEIVSRLTRVMRFRTVDTMLSTGRGQELYEAHQELYRMLAEKKMEDMNQTVRKTYFLNVADGEEDDESPV